MKQKLGLTILLSIFFITVAKAQTDSTKIIKRLELGAPDIIRNTSKQQKVVSASRSAKNVSDLPVTLYVIKREEIIKNNYITLVDVLKTLPGFRVSQPGSGDVGEMFYMKGMSGNYYTKILVNNIPIQPSVSFGMPIGAQLPVRQAERIEIIYGPASALYGSDATTGVINIITKKAENSSFAHADIELGSNQFSYYNFIVGAKAGKGKNVLNFSMFGSKYEFGDLNIIHKRSNVFSPINCHFFLGLQAQLDENTIRQITDFNQSDFNKLPPEGQQYIESELALNYEGDISFPTLSRIPQGSSLIGGTLEYRNFTFNVMHMERYDHSSLGRSSFLFKYNDPQNYIGEDITNISANHDFSTGKLNFSTSLSYLSMRLDNSSSRGLTYNRENPKVYVFSASDDIFFEEIITYSPLKNLELVGGVSFQYSGNLPKTNDLEAPFDIEDYKPFSEEALPEHPYFGNFGLNPFVFHNKALLFQTIYSLGNFSFIGGLRHDNNSLYGTSNNPRIAVLFKLNQQQSVRGSVGYAFKAPSGDLIYHSIATKSYSYDEDSIKLYGLKPKYLQTNDSISYEAIPNKNLKPERIKNFELGYRANFGENINLDIAFNYSIVKEPISSHFTQVDTLTYPKTQRYGTSSELARTNKNSDNAYINMYQGQALLEINELIPSIKLNTRLGLNYAFGEEKLAEDAGKVNFIRQQPEWMGNLMLSAMPLKNLYVNTNIVFMTDFRRKFAFSEKDYDFDFTKTKGYFTTDLLVNYKLGYNFEVYCKVLNLFDKEYGGIDATNLDVDMRYNPQLKRNIRFGLIYRRE